MKVAIAVDENPVSKYAFNWTLRNLCSTSDEVVLLTVPHKHAVYASDFQDVVEVLEADEEAVESAENLLKKLADELQSKQIKFSGYCLKDFDVGYGLVKKMEETGCDCLVIGSRKLGGVARFFIGSVGDYCVHNSHCPVLVCKMPSDDCAESDPTLGSDRRQFLLAVDETAPSEFAFEWATQHYLKEGDALILTAVVNTGKEGEISDQSASTPAVEKAKALLDRFATRASKFDVSKKLLSGKNVGETLCKYAADSDLASIILGSNERGVIGRAVFGSVCDRCCHEAPCPVLVCKRPASTGSKKA